MRIIGIDPGLARVGYGIIEVKNESKILLDCGVIETGKDKKEEDRLYEIFQDLNELINHWKPTAAAVEKFFFYRSSTTISVVQARGVIMMVLASKKIHVSEYAPAQIKLTIAGSGKASKKDILDAVMNNLDLNKPPKPDDSADALAIALTKLNEDGFN
ncbi:crossover junction endodeoxyribonuclease RuvC [Prochlorococcus sp. AH-716-P13]|nr:crossover junction endodeoxyribonuclease RuvC [Prochlorococcus sp. AH-716-P13]